MLLFDVNTLQQHRNRASSRFDNKLFTHVAQQLRDRIELLRVPFESALDLTPFHTGGLFPFFQDRFASTQWTSFSGSFESLQKNSFDLIVSALEVHWVDQVPSFLAQLQTYLKPGGLLLCSFWGGETLKELRQALLHAENLCYGRASPRVIPMLSLEESTRLLQTSGFTLPVADQETFTLLYPTLDRLFQHLRTMGETNALKCRQPLTRRLLQETESFYRHTYETPLHELPATYQLITLTGWRDNPDQPQPLRRGSATHRLEDVFDKQKP